MDDDLLLRRLPPIRRARDYYLYDLRGRRYLDMWLADGRALLGHRPEGLLKGLKNDLSRGLLADFPSVYERRLSKALALLMPGYAEFRLYRSSERLLSAVAPLAVPTWRPFLSDRDGREERAAVVTPALPLPIASGPAVAAFRGKAPDAAAPSDVVSPALLGALTKSVYLLIRFRERYTENLWRRFDAPFWSRSGPYLTATCGEREYSALFDRLLARGILISPRFPGPSIAPGLGAIGELTSFRDEARSWRGEE